MLLDTFDAGELVDLVVDGVELADIDKSVGHVHLHEGFVELVDILDFFYICCRSRAQGYGLIS